MQRQDEIKVHKDYSRFLDMVSKTGEHFEEYIVIVKAPNGTLDWRSSDKSWAMGATERYLNLCHAEDEINMHRSIE